MSTHPCFQSRGFLMDWTIKEVSASWRVMESFIRQANERIGPDMMLHISQTIAPSKNRSVISVVLTNLTCANKMNIYAHMHGSTIGRTFVRCVYHQWRQFQVKTSFQCPMQTTQCRQVSFFVLIFKRFCEQFH